MIPINQRIRFVLKLFSNYFFRSSRDDSSSHLTDRKNREILTMSFEIAKKKKKEKLRVKLYSYNFVREMFESSRVYSSRLNKFIYKLETIILFSKKRREEIFHKFIIHNTFEFQWRGEKKTPNQCVEFYDSIIIRRIQSDFSWKGNRFDLKTKWARS